MASFRKEILAQIGRIDTGRIFTLRDLSFDMEKTANVAVLLSELSRKGGLVRIEKRAYYRPKQSVLELGKLPVYQDEQFRYLTEKLNGYIAVTYVYNKMGLTEQAAIKYIAELNSDIYKEDLWEIGGNYRKLYFL